MLKKLVKILYSWIRDMQHLLSKYVGSEVLVLGDSHANVFSRPSFLFHYPLIYFNIIAVSGATASGLENPRAKTQAYQKFEEKLMVFIGRKVILLLGEVDTGFVIWYRAQKYNESVEEMARLTQVTYQRFIDRVAASFDLIVVSCPLPTIQDNSDLGEVAQARRDIQAPQLQRIYLAVEFNLAIQRHCESKNIKYINLDDESLGPDRLVKKELLNKNPANHHYDQRTYASMLADRLANLL